jgi:hypothetical protein
MTVNRDRELRFQLMSESTPKQGTLNRFRNDSVFQNAGNILPFRNVLERFMFRNVPILFSACQTAFSNPPPTTIRLFTAGGGEYLTRMVRNSGEAE